MEIPKLEHMTGSGSENLSSISELSDQLIEEKGPQKICVSHHQSNGLEYTSQSHKASDSFIVDIERFASHLTTDKDINANSRTTLQRSLSRKVPQQRGAEKKSNSITNNERDNNGSLPISPRASLLPGSSTPEKPMVVVVGATDHSVNPQVHNPITIMTGIHGAAVAESKSNSNSTISRRFSFRRSSALSRAIDPRKILFFFATLSSMGTILLIFFTLSMNKLSGDDNGLN